MSKFKTFLRKTGKLLQISYEKLGDLILAGIAFSLYLLFHSGAVEMIKEFTAVTYTGDKLLYISLTLFCFFAAIGSLWGMTFLIGDFFREVKEEYKDYNYWYNS